MLLDSLTRRIVAAVLLTFALTTTLVMVWQHIDYETNLGHLEQRSITRVSVAATKLLATVQGQAEREAFIANVNAVLPLQLSFTDDIPPETEPNTSIPHVLADLGPGFEVATVDGLAPVSDRLTPVIVTLPDGQRLATSYFFGPLAVISPPAWSVLVIASCALLALLVWLSLSLTRKLAAFARRATEYDPVSNNRSFPVEGPTELRSLATAFNLMVERISTLLQSQRLALSSVGHDLRTPITRLRLRAEALPVGEARQAIMRDLDYMATMVDEALSYLRGERRGSQPHEATDLAAILEAVADDFRDLGHPVHYAGPDRLIVQGHSESLFRLFDNLLANATRFANYAAIDVRIDEGRLVVVIDDDGPGLGGTPLPDAAHPPHGDGLGLPIARSIARAHGGQLDLLESPLGGVRVEVSIAMRRAPDAPARPAFFETLAEIGA